MGLDMYLNKMPRYGKTTAKDVNNIESYLSWLEAREKGVEVANCSLKEWCGVSEENLPPQKTIDFYTKHYDIKYWSWDTEHNHGHKMIMQQIADWRKANAIHKWFVDTIQNGIDDCRYHREVTEDDLRELLDICHTVLLSCDDDGNITDTSVAEELLPSQSGFFFGSTAYDEWYVDDLKNTIAMIEKILKETDFDMYAIYYVSSW